MVIRKFAVFVFVLLLMGSAFQGLVAASASEQPSLTTPGGTSRPYTPARLSDTAPAANTKPDARIVNPKPSTRFRPNDTGPMRFVVVRNAGFACEPKCPEWISASGIITLDTPAKLRKVFKQLGKRKLPIVINSSGGDVKAAMVIGRLIRQRGIDTAVGQTLFVECVPDQKGCRLDRYSDGAYAGFAYPGDAYCMSACPFVVAGGSTRLVGAAQIGVHQITRTVTQTRVDYRTRYAMVRGKRKLIKEQVTTTGSYETTLLDNDYIEKLSAYFTEMGVGDAIVDKMLSVSASDIFIFLGGELRNFKLVTGPGDVGDLTAEGRCALNPNHGNCVELPGSKS